MGSKLETQRCEGGRAPKDPPHHLPTSWGQPAKPRDRGKARVPQGVSSPLCSPRTPRLTSPALPI